MTRSFNAAARRPWRISDELLFIGFGLLIGTVFLLLSLWLYPVPPCH